MFQCFFPVSQIVSFSALLMAVLQRVLAAAVFYCTGVGVCGTERQFKDERETERVASGVTVGDILVVPGGDARSSAKRQG